MVTILILFGVGLYLIGCLAHHCRVYRECSLGRRHDFLFADRAHLQLVSLARVQGTHIHVLGGCRAVRDRARNWIGAIPLAAGRMT